MKRSTRFLFNKNEIPALAAQSTNPNFIQVLIEIVCPFIKSSIADTLLTPTHTFSIGHLSPDNFCLPTFLFKKKYIYNIEKSTHFLMKLLIIAYILHSSSTYMFLVACAIISNNRTPLFELSDVYTLRDSSIIRLLFLFYSFIVLTEGRKAQTH